MKRLVAKRLFRFAPITRVGLTLACCAVGVLARPAAAEEVDFELVLAVDISASMNADEARIQRQGYIDALSDPEFLRAVKRGGRGRIAISYVEWAGAGQQWLTLPWTVIDSAQSAQAFAERIPMPRDINQQGTSIANGIRFATAEIERNGYDAPRRTIDISGDGPNNAGTQVRLASDDAASRGITINGLPIINHDGSDFAGIDRYYADCVIGGPGAFIIPVQSMAEFATAIRRKLILEVIGAAETSPQGALLAHPAASADCLIGEKHRNRFIDRFLPSL